MYRYINKGYSNEVHNSAMHLREILIGLTNNKDALNELNEIYTRIDDIFGEKEDDVDVNDYRIEIENLEKWYFNYVNN